MARKWLTALPVSLCQVLQINRLPGAFPNVSISFAVNMPIMNVQSHKRFHCHVCILSMLSTASFFLSCWLPFTHSSDSSFNQSSPPASLSSLKGVALINYSVLALINLCPCEKETLITVWVAYKCNILSSTHFTSWFVLPPFQKLFQILRKFDVFVW